jgi:RsiW-degrading membrane proteinase PrsW (M82 family)
VSDHEDAVVDDEPMAVAAAPDAAQDPHDHLKRWTLVLVLVAVWIVAAIIGLALYLWWYHSIDKTPALFVVLVYLVVCTVAAMLTAMVQNKPLVSALAIALVSAPFASTAAASVLYGIYYCDRASRCLVGLIPY